MVIQDPWANFFPLLWCFCCLILRHGLGAILVLYMGDKSHSLLSCRVWELLLFVIQAWEPFPIIIETCSRSYCQLLNMACEPFLINLHGPWAIIDCHTSKGAILNFHSGTKSHFLSMCVVVLPSLSATLNCHKGTGATLGDHSGPRSCFLSVAMCCCCFIVSHVSGTIVMCHIWPISHSLLSYMYMARKPLLIVMQGPWTILNCHMWPTSRAQLL